MATENREDRLPPKEHRCFCGQLLARKTPSGLELKCKRCKRIDVISWSYLMGIAVS